LRDFGNLNFSGADESGAEAAAVQTLREVRAHTASAQRLDCARLTAAFRTIWQTTI
jgi:hypothetical protein